MKRTRVVAIVAVFAIIVLFQKQLWSVTKAESDANLAKTEENILSQSLIKELSKAADEGKKSSQLFFQRLHQIALKGMNYGRGDFINSSGEQNVIKQLLSEKDKNYIVFDVGANVGVYSINVLDTCKNVKLYSFEPSTAAFSKLKTTLCTHQNVTLWNIGFGDKNEVATLYSNSPGSGIASVYKRKLEHYGIKTEITEKISLRRLDDFCIENNISRIDLLKLDVEGNEYKILNGAKRMFESQSIDFIQFEFGGPDIDARVFFKDLFYLLNPKYHIYRVLQDGLMPIDKYDEIFEIYLTTNYVAISRRLSWKND